MTKPHGRSWTSSVVTAFVVGIATPLLLFPAHAVDTLPRPCFAALGYVVPCEASVAWVVAIAVAGVVGFGLSFRHRRRQRIARQRTML